MKRFLKVILPPLIAFLVFAVIIKYNPIHHSFEGLSDIGDGSAAGLITYYKIFAPFQFLIAALTQYLIILPLWDRILERHIRAVGTFIGILLVCIIAAGGLAYVIWDKAIGTTHLIHIGLFMTGVQLFYWLINFLVMFLMDWKTFKLGNVAPQIIEEGKD
jgi:quinol-cytochrome oxidoreductase complex cytochrome b subunit